MRQRKLKGRRWKREGGRGRWKRSEKGGGGSGGGGGNGGGGNVGGGMEVIGLVGAGLERGCVAEKGEWLLWRTERWG